MGPLMKPPRTRLTCRAHNCYSPSIALWEHFFGTTNRPLPCYQRLASTIAEITRDGTEGDAQLEPDNALEEHDQHIAPAPQVRRMTTVKGTWRPSKVDASIARNLQYVYATRQSSMNDVEELLAAARSAFQDGRDYEGAVVQSIQHPTPVKESALPWSLPKEDMNIGGIERLAAEIDKFYQFSQLNYYETLARKHVVEQVQEHVRQTLPKHTLEVFGSERTGLAMATSDIDLRLMANEPLKNPALSTRHVPRNQRHAAIHKLRTLYWKNLHKHKAYLLPQLQYARYPLISLQDRQSGLDVQIVLVNDSSRQRQLVKEYMEQYPYLRQLFYVVKTIFDVRGLNDVFRGGFGSYTVFMMVVASIRHKPHPRNDAAGGLINFLKFYRDFDYTEKGLSIEPARQFPKGEDHVMTRKAKTKLKEGQLKLPPPYMLVLRDPADETHDLGCKAIAIKHVQTTFKALVHQLDRDVAINTRHSLLGPLVGASYMLNKERRQKLQDYGRRISQQVQKTLAAKARQIRESDGMGKS